MKIPHHCPLKDNTFGKSRPEKELLLEPEADEFPLLVSPLSPFLSDGVAVPLLGPVGKHDLGVLSLNN